MSFLGKTQVPRDQGDVFELIILSNKQSKTQRLSIYKDMKQEKAANHHIWEAVTSTFGMFAWQITWMINQIIKIDDD